MITRIVVTGIPASTPAEEKPFWEKIVGLEFEIADNGTITERRIKQFGYPLMYREALKVIANCDQATAFYFRDRYWSIKVDESSIRYPDFGDWVYLPKGSYDICV